MERTVYVNPQHSFGMCDHRMSMCIDIPNSRTTVVDETVVSTQ